MHFAYEFVLYIDLFHVLEIIALFPFNFWFFAVPKAFWLNAIFQYDLNPLVFEFFHSIKFPFLYIDLLIHQAFLLILISISQAYLFDGSAQSQWYWVFYFHWDTNFPIFIFLLDNFHSILVIFSHILIQFDYIFSSICLFPLIILSIGFIFLNHDNF